MKTKFKNTLLSALILSTSLSGFALGVSAETATETQYIKLYENYTVGEFLERYKLNLPEGVSADLEKALGSGFSAKDALGDYITVLSGDADGDGLVSSTDYLKLKKHILKDIELDGAFLEAADVNEDGAVDSTDLLRVKSSFLGEYNMNLSIKSKLDSYSYYSATSLATLEKETMEYPDSAFLLKIRIDGVDSSVSRLGKELDLKKYVDPDYNSMQVSFTITEILSESGKDKFTVGQKLTAGQDFVHLMPNGKGTYQLITSRFNPQLPLTEVGREYIVLMRDLRFRNSNGVFTEERTENLPYSLYGIAPTWTKNLNSIDMFADMSFSEIYQDLVEEIQGKYCVDESIPDERTKFLIPTWCLT
ncbi:MAG: hypothetical protein E7614_03970 [Ruminococcaceae bacterium]|nr:hypothetical protein [Oscillospiraceae bacterium]